MIEIVKKYPGNLNPHFAEFKKYYSKEMIAKVEECIEKYSYGCKFKSITNNEIWTCGCDFQWQSNGVIAYVLEKSISHGHIFVYINDYGFAEQIF